MSESMLERVARAIMESRGGCDVVDWREAEWNPHVAEAIKEARAAIEAMREPSGDMRLASLRYKRKASVYSGPECYRRMIDAALK